jgi:hypothetical protein
LRPSRTRAVDTVIRNRPEEEEEEEEEKEEEEESARQVLVRLFPPAGKRENCVESADSYACWEMTKARLMEKETEQTKRQRTHTHRAPTSRHCVMQNWYADWPVWIVLSS